jgi:hypothetical protein
LISIRGEGLVPPLYSSLKGFKMTLPDERYKAIKQGRKLLEELCDPGRSPRVPAIIRERARGALRHYPSDYELEAIARSSPDYLDPKPFSIYNVSNK